MQPFPSAMERLRDGRLLHAVVLVVRFVSLGDGSPVADVAVQGEIPGGAEQVWIAAAPVDVAQVEVQVEVAELAAIPDGAAAPVAILVEVGAGLDSGRGCAGFGAGRVSGRGCSGRVSGLGCAGRVSGRGCAGCVAGLDSAGRVSGLGCAGRVSGRG